MHDSEFLLAEVRRDAAYAFRHDFAVVQDRARRRTRRRRAVAGTTVALSVALSLAAYAQLVPAGRADSAPGVSRSSMGSPTTTGATVDAPFPAVGFDAGWFYLPYYECPGNDCARFVAVSHDRGKTWQRTRLEDPPGPTTLLGVTPLGPLTAALQVQDFSGVVHVLTTADAGATWRRATTQAARSSVPANAWPVWQEGWDGTARLLAVDPEAGTVAPLTNQPGLNEAALVPGIHPTGPIWVRGKTADGRAAVAVSNDRGRTWSTHVFPEAGDVLVATRDGRTAYAAVNPQTMSTPSAPGNTVGAATGGEASPRSTIWTTQDGGVSWQPAAGSIPTDSVTAAAVLPEGTLVVRASGSHPAATYRSGDAARTFTEVTGVPGLTLRTLSDGSYIASDLAERAAGNRVTGTKPNQVYLSSDGESWTAVPYPAP